MTRKMLMRFSIGVFAVAAAFAAHVPAQDGAPPQSGVSARVSLVGGAEFSGTLTQFGGATLAFSNPGGPESVDHVSKIVFGASSNTDVPPYAPDAEALLALSDGTTCAAANVRISDKKLAFALPGVSVAFNIPCKFLSGVSLKPTDLASRPSVAQKWAEHMKTAAVADTVAALNGDRLVTYPGLVVSLDEQVLRFENEGQVLDLRRSRIFGVLFANLEPLEFPKMYGVVTASGIGRLSVASWNLDVSAVPPVLRCVTLWGDTVALPLELVREIDFPANRDALLCNLEPEKSAHTPYFSAFGGTNVVKTAPSLTVQRAAVAETAMTARSARVAMGGETYENLVVVKTRTELEYRIPSGKTTFAAGVGIADASRPDGAAKIRFLLDGAEVRAEVLSGSEAPKRVEIPLGAARRLQIVADYGEGLNFAHYVGLGDAKFSK